MKHQCESFDGSCSIRMVDSGFSRWSGSTLRMTTNPLRLAASGPGYPAGGQTRFMSARMRILCSKNARTASKTAIHGHSWPFFAFFAPKGPVSGTDRPPRSEEHTSELQSLMRISYAVFCLNNKNKKQNNM